MISIGISSSTEHPWTIRENTSHWFPVQPPSDLGHEWDKTKVRVYHKIQNFYKAEPVHILCYRAKWFSTIEFCTGVILGYKFTVITNYLKGPIPLLLHFNTNINGIY